MTHKSRLGALVIDCQDGDLNEAARFWSAALSYAAEPVTEGFEDYRQLKTPGEAIEVLIQRVAHPSRVHLDIETDNKEAERDRLLALGAKVVEIVDEDPKHWIVMEAPTGHRFCLVGPQRVDFADNANRWDET